MIERHFEDEDLMAFADGEADPRLRAEIERAMAGDSAIAARVKMFSDSRDQAKAALGPLLSEPVPDELLTRITAMVDDRAGNEGTDTQNIHRLKSGSAKPATFKRPYVALPLAASVMLIAGGIAGFFLGQSNQPVTGGVQMVSLDRPAIVRALNTLTSGKEISIGDEGVRFRAIATFIDADQTLCREFEVDQANQVSVVAVACRAGEAWEVQFTVIATGQSSSGYAPASSLQTLEAYLEAIGAKAPLTAEAEAAAIKNLR